MKKMALSVAACALVLLAGEAEAQSVVRSGVIHFQGAIVESSYEIAPASEMSTGESVKLIEVEPGVVIAVIWPREAPVAASRSFPRPLKRLKTSH